MILIGLTISQFSFAQLFEQFSIEDIPEAGSIDAVVVKENMIYYGGTTFDSEQGFQPVVRKVNHFGEVIWSTTTNDTLNHYSVYSELYHAAYNLFVSNDGFLYAFIRLPTSIDPIRHKLWKIDPIDGSFIYRVDLEFMTDNQAEIEEVYDWQGDSIMIAYPSESNSNTWKNSLAYISRTTGSLISTHLLRTVPTDLRYYDIELDVQQTGYYNVIDTIFKFDPNDIDNTIWSTHVPYFDESVFRELIYHEDDNSIIAVGFIDSYFEGVVAKLNATTGQILWQFDVETNLNSDYSDAVIVGNYLYVLWTSYQTSNSGIYVNKINLTTGVADWESSDWFVPGSVSELRGLDLKVDGNMVFCKRSSGSW